MADRIIITRQPDRIVASGVTRVITGARGLPGATGAPGLVVSETEPTPPAGGAVLWLKSGAGPSGDQFELLIVT